MEINWTGDFAISAQRVLIVSLLVMAILGIAVMLAPSDERRRGR